LKESHVAEPDIDALLRQDEAELRAKRKRLKEFAAALKEVRTAHEAASKLAAELLDAGDVTRAELGRVFDLSKPERAALIPASKRSGTKADAGSSDAVAD
jgi:hypothetical protein